MKSLFINKLIVLLFLAFNLGIANAQIISIENGSGCLNDTSLISINYNNITSLGALTMNISYDTSMLTYLGHTNADPLLPNLMSGVPTTGPEAWKIVISWIDNGSSGVNLTSGKLCDLKFIYKGNFTNLTILSNSELADFNLVPIATTFINGSIGSTLLSQPASTQICENTQANYMVTAVAGCSYQWQIQNGVLWDNLQDNSFYSGTNSAALQISNTPYSFNNAVFRCVVTKNCSVITNNVTLGVYQKPLIAINNDTSICINNSILLDANGTSGILPLTYNWDNGLGNGISHLITPIFSTTYKLTVTDGNSCISIDSVLVTVNPLPEAAGLITGLSTVCQGQNGVTYSVPIINNATSYIWTLPSGASGISTTNSITVDYSNTAVSGNITVYGNNSCGNGSISTYSITVNPLPEASSFITGLSTVCQGQNGVTYTVPIINNATSYNWTLPSGASGISTTNSITVDYSNTAVSGNITVYGNNSCGNGTISTYSITVNPLPEAAGLITGLSTVCQGQNGVIYSVPIINNATSYNWTLPSGASGISTTNSITVDYSNTAVSGNITVYGNNSCGNGSISTYSITVNGIPLAPTIVSPIIYCQNDITLPLTANGSNLLWYLTPSGGIGNMVSPTPSSLLAGTTNFYVTQTINNCESPRNQLDVIINPILTPSVSIVATSNPVSFATPVTFTATPINGGVPVYQWKVNNINMGNNSNSFTYTPLNGDIIKVEMTSDLNCLSTTLATSYEITINVNIPVNAIWTGTIDNNWFNDANWNPYKPGPTSNVSIPAGLTNYPTLSDNVTINNIVFESNTNGTATLVEGNYILTISGAVNIQRYLPTNTANNQWHFISMPMPLQNSSLFNGMFLQYFNEAWVGPNGSPWTDITSSSSILQPGVGYSVWSDVNSTITYSGSDINSGNFNIPLAYSPMATYAGYNLVGNPYPSAINTLNFNTAFPWSNNSDIEASLYIWDNGNYAVNNGIFGTGSFSNNLIPAYQGFMMKCNSSTNLLLPVNAQSHGGSFLKTAVSDLLKLKVKGNNYEDEIAINFKPNASNGYDANYDAEKLYGENGAPQLYSETNGKKYSINILPSLVGNIDINIGFECSLSNTYTLIADGTTSFANGTTIVLEDTKTNSFIDLNQQSVYTFAGVANDIANRFRLHFGSNLISENILDKIRIYSNENFVYIDNSKLENIENIIVTNILGQQTMHVNSNNTVMQKIDMSNKKGCYLIQVKTLQNIYNQKVIIN